MMEKTDGQQVNYQPKENSGEGDQFRNQAESTPEIEMLPREKIIVKEADFHTKSTKILFRP